MRLALWRRSEGAGRGVGPTRRGCQPAYKDRHNWLPQNPLHSNSGGVTLCSVTLRNRSDRPLTELQQKILDFLWVKGPATAEKVRESLLPDHPLKDSSVRTLLRRLETQGHLTHKMDGKSYLYAAKAPSASLATGTIRHLIDRFWAGSAEQFVAGMVDAKVLSVEALQRLARKVKAPK